MAKLKFWVNIDDIEKGAERNFPRGQTCPIARAIKRRIPNAKILVAHNNASIDNKVNLRLPDSAIEFQFMADRYLSVEPFSFEADIL